VFDAGRIAEQAPHLLACLAKLVQGLLAEQKAGMVFSTPVRVEIGNAVQVIMRSTRPKDCPI
jgi:hypothetical protein